MQNNLKNQLSFFLLFSVSITCTCCSKQDAAVSIDETVTQQLYISCTQDTLPLLFSITAVRRENIGSLSATAIEGKFADSSTRKNSLIIRVMGDSIRPYSHTEILASYTDSLGILYANSLSDTSNKVSITKMEKKKNGLVQGSFTIAVSNSTSNKTYVLKEGKFYSTFADY